MSKFKVGDRVRVVKPDGQDIVNGAVEGLVTTVKEVDGQYIYLKDINQSCFVFESALKPAEKTLDDLEVGDVIVDPFGNEVTITEVGRSYRYTGTGLSWTSRELEIRGFKIKPPSTETVLTLQEIADKFNVDVKQLRIKD